jgi:glycosyltransferase involved in cell wall biosynthesis
MKIAIWHNLPSGGGKRALYQHVRGLLQRGHELRAWCPPTADRSYLPLAPLICEQVVPLDYEFAKPFKWGISGLRGRYKSISRLFRAIDRHSRRCADEMAQWGCDVVFANPCSYLSAGPIGRHVTGRPAVLYLQEPNRRLHEAIPSLIWAARPCAAGTLWSRGPRAWMKGAIERAKDLHDVGEARVLAREEGISAAAYDMILVNSYYSRESIIRAYGLDARVCYLGVDAELFRPLDLPRERHVIGLGAVVPYKGLESAVRAIGCLPEPRPPLLWVGNMQDDDYRGQMERLAQSLGVDLRIHRGVSDSVLVEMLNRAALLLYTSRLEPFGFAPLEASACGTAVVAVQEGGVRESMREGCLFSERDPQMLASAVRRLLDDPGLAAQLGKAGISHVRESWTLEKATERIEARLLEAVGAAQTGASTPLVSGCRE